MCFIYIFCLPALATTQSPGLLCDCVAIFLGTYVKRIRFAQQWTKYLIKQLIIQAKVLIVAIACMSV
jgi:hypothetical protein